MNSEQVKQAAGTPPIKDSTKKLNCTSLVCGILIILWALAIVWGAIRGH